MALRGRSIVALASVAALGGALAVQACSSSDPVTDTSPDASAEGSSPEAAIVDAAPPEPECDLDADLLAKVKDASIGDGSSTTGICLGCARKQCDKPIADCTHDCLCQSIVSDAIGCYLTTQQIGCAAKLANYLVKPVTRQYALAVLGCVQEECPVECAVDAGMPTDAGADADGS